MKISFGSKGVLTILLVLFSLNIFPGQDDAVSMYELIGRTNLLSMPKKEEKKEDVKASLNSVDDPYAFYKQQKLENFNPSCRDLRELAFGLLKDADKSVGNGFAQPVIDTTTWGDLNLLSGSEKHPEIYLGKIIDRTNTEIGGAYFFSQLAQPTDNREVLAQRQGLARYWVDFPEEAKRVDEILKVMPQGEAQLLLFGKALGIVQAIRGSYFHYSMLGSFNDVLNDNETVLDVDFALDRMKVFAEKPLRIGAPLLLVFFGLAEIINGFADYNVDFTRNEGKNNTLASLWNGFSLAIKQLGNYTDQAHALGGLTPSLISSECLSHGITWASGLVSMYVGCKLLFTSKDYLQATDLGECWKALLFQKMCILSQYVRQMRKLHTMICARPYLQKRLYYFKPLHRFFTGADKNVARLVQFLESPTFDNSKQKIYHGGYVLVAYKLLLEPSVQDQFATAAMSIAEIDASLSVAKLFNEFKDKPVHYSFVDYTNNATPRIELNDYWNPFVDPSAVIPNSLKLGSELDCANIVVTGPNSGGKSTILKSIAIALIMGQSLGIAPATKVSMTPFHYIATYMGITDDIADKASLHQAEVDRTNRLAKMIAQMPHDQFSFVMFDELFNGTNPNEGTALAYATAEVLGSFPHCVSVIASHYPYITSLETKTGRHKNYHVSVDEEDGIIKRNYKLEPGISHQQIGIKVARERGCNGDIIDRAQEVIEELKHSQS